MLPPACFVMREPGVLVGGGDPNYTTMTHSPKTAMDKMVQRIDNDLKMNMFDNCLVPDMKDSSPGGGPLPPRL